MRTNTSKTSVRQPLTWLAAAVVGISTLAPSAAMAADSQLPAAQTGIVRQFRFKGRKDIQVPILRREVFQAQFGQDARIPKTDEAVIRFAKQLYSARFDQPIEREPCGEADQGRLMAALSNPQISDAARGAVDAAADADIPDLPQTYEAGHFRIQYTMNDPDAAHNVTLEQVKATCADLNSAWEYYARFWKTPKHYVSGGKQLLDVKVYDMAAGTSGQTNSGWNHIELDAQMAVANACERESTVRHEMFHRVQYAYGFTSGTPDLKWAVEGSATWSQWFTFRNDWMGWANDGLQNPNRPLLRRSYDAVHFWVYLHERANDAFYRRLPVKRAWEIYETNGKNMKAAVDQVVKEGIAPNYSFDAIAGDWLYTNFAKDFPNTAKQFDYYHDDLTLSCGTKINGPLASVPRKAASLKVGQKYATVGAVEAYGADYYVFDIGAWEKVKISCAKVRLPYVPAENLGYAIGEIKDGKFTWQQSWTWGSVPSFEFTKSYASGGPSQIVVMVFGNPDGGLYTLAASGEEAISQPFNAPKPRRSLFALFGP